MVAYAQGKADGVGIVLTGDGLIGVDIDGCLDPTTGEITAEAAEVVKQLDSYTEITPSQTGLRVFTTGTLPLGRRVLQRRNHRGIELYSDRRFLTVTGRRWSGTPATINERTAALGDVHRMLFDTSTPPSSPTDRPGGLPLDVTDQELLERARTARNGALFVALYDVGDVSAYPFPERGRSGAVLPLGVLDGTRVGPDGPAVSRVGSDAPEVGRGPRRYHVRGADPPTSRRSHDRHVEGPADIGWRGGH
jgi:hypothetical protein